MTWAVAPLTLYVGPGLPTQKWPRLVQVVEQTVTGLFSSSVIGDQPIALRPTSEKNANHEESREQSVLSRTIVPFQASYSRQHEWLRSWRWPDVHQACAVSRSRLPFLKNLS